jgi:hypothetical protein
MADSIFPIYSGEIQLFDYLLKLKSYLFEFMLEYSPESTDVNTPIEEVLRITERGLSGLMRMCSFRFAARTKYPPVMLVDI